MKNNSQNKNIKEVKEIEEPKFKIKTINGIGRLEIKISPKIEQELKKLIIQTMGVIK